MENASQSLLRLELPFPSDSSLLPVFFYLLLSYVFIVVANVGNTVLILRDHSLHQPMYLLLCNLSINDFIGSTHIIPKLLCDMLRSPTERTMSYPDCVTQAFVGHIFGTASHTVLMIMAFDRYVAICKPLRYHSIMNCKMLVKLSALAWGMAFVPVSILIGLSVRLTRCRNLVANLYCDNPSLFKLSCESTFINNVYGLLFTVLLLSASIGSMLLTYSRITLVCLRADSSSLNRRALQTCSTHLLVYLLQLLSGAVVIVLHRYPHLSHYRKLASILLITVPGSMNPVIYGVQSRDIRHFWAQALRPCRKT